MKVFVNLLIAAEGTDADRVEDEVLAALEAEGIKVVWSRSNAAKED